MIEVFRVTQTEREAKRVQLRHRPGGIDVERRPHNEVGFAVTLRERDVVIPFDADSRGEGEADRTDCKIVFIAKLRLLRGCPIQSERIAARKLRRAHRPEAGRGIKRPKSAKKIVRAGLRRGRENSEPCKRDNPAQKTIHEVAQIGGRWFARS